MKNINAIYSLIISNLKKLNVIYNKNNYKKEQSFYTNKSDIISWLEQYNITNYELIKNDKYGYVVDVDNNVNLSLRGLSHIPVKFGNINGIFSCIINNLTNLEFCPISTSSHFSCSNNNLTSLEFCPITVGGDFYCSDNKLSSLEFCPTTIGGDFYCIKNNLTNLAHFPNHIGRLIDLRMNGLIDVDMNKHYNFEEIYPIHIEHKITAEQGSLEKYLNKPNRKVSVKIKI